MKQLFISFLLSLTFLGGLAGQKVPLSYYLPEIEYQANIPTPEAFFGFQVGDWHLSHDQLLSYLKHISSLSSKAKWVEHGISPKNCHSKMCYTHFLNVPCTL